MAKQIKSEAEGVSPAEKFEKAVKKELTKLRALLKEVPDAKRKAADGLMNRAAYMLATLEQYEDDLKTNGHTEMFTQSEKTDPYERERPVARLYNSMIKNYQSCMRTLFDLIPDQVKADDSGTDPNYNKFFNSSNGKK